uniref:Uncharacterized protein n=1 Tax=Setaria italica TaxID=4555 RepID=K3ZPR2_SETIT
MLPGQCRRPAQGHGLSLLGHGEWPMDDSEDGPRLIQDDIK